MPPPLPRLLGAALVGAVILLAWLAWQRPAGPGEPAPSPAAVASKRTSGSQAVTTAPATPLQQARALESLLTDQPFVLLENGRPRRFRLSLDQVFIPHAQAGKRLTPVAPQPNARALMAEATRMASGRPSGWVLVPADHPEAGPAFRRVLSHRLWIEANDAQAALTLLTSTGMRPADDLPLQAGRPFAAEAISGDPSAALGALAQLSGHPAIKSASPELLHQHAKKLLPNDPLFSQQWHLKNTSQGGGKLGSDINVVPVWDTHMGQGIRIGIVDDGLETTHPDLVDNVDTANDYDWNGLDNDPTPNPANDDTHGTPAAGIAAARGNNALGVSGVAPRAQLVGFRLISDFTTDTQDAEAMSLHNDIIQVKSNSWGQPDAPWETFPPGTQFELARKQAVTTGRGGLGTIFVWAAGNGRGIGDQGNKDGIANSIYALTVGALANNGALASYSETGAHLTAVAPSSGGTRDITTVDLTGADGIGGLADLNYTGGFTGTSASAPVAAGVVALMLEAKPNLNWRDVKEILLRSSTKVFPTDIGWVSRTGGDSPALPPIKHHHSYGGGLINAQAAVQLAKTWTSLGAPVEVSRTQTFVPPYQSIPDNNTTGVTVPLDFSGIDPMRVEHVTITVNIQHTYRGDLQITLQSPGGVVSTLATKELNDDDDAGYYDWTFSSMRHWGESGQGIWQVTVKDLSAADVGRIVSARVNLHGAAAAPAEIASLSAPALLVGEGEELKLSAEISGYGHITQQWRLGATVVDSDTEYLVASAATSHAGTYQFTAANLTGAATSASVPVGVLRRSISPLAVNEGATLVLKAVAAGPGLTYDWLKNGQPLVNDTRISGAQSATLTIKNAAPADEDSYVCRVMLPSAGLTLDTLPAAVTIIRKPVVTAPLIGTGVVSGLASYLFAASNSATRFTATGVPPGMKFDTKTGALSGRPTTAKTYTVKVTATNSAGVSPPAEVAWTIESFPLLARGAFSGLVERSAALNSGLGGRLTMNVTSGGGLTGTLTLGTKSHRLTGQVDALPGNAAPSVHLTIKRTGLASLALDLTLDLATGLVTGTVAADGQQAAVTARRNPWSSAQKAAGYPGAYNAVLQPAAVVAGNPQGEGYAILTTTATGGATWAGKLADGVSITGGVTFAETGEIPLHLLLYNGTGSIQGWSAIDGANGLFDGEFDWLKNPQAPTSTTRSYKGGFPLHTLTLVGNKYTKPAANTPVIGLSVTASNARLTFSLGALAAPLSQDLTITAANAVKFPTGAANPQLVRLTLNAATGLISGGFTLKDNDPTDTTAPIAVVTRTPTFAGVLITRAGFNQGRGYVLLPELPSLGPPKTTVNTSPILSGSVVLEAVP